MQIASLDPRTLVVTLARPDAGLFWNWSTNAYEQPFAPANHTRPLVAMADSTGTFAQVQTADIGTELLSRPDVVAVISAVSGTGATATYTPVDVWTQSSIATPCAGGFLRL